MKKITIVMILIIVLVGCQNEKVSEKKLNEKIEVEETIDNDIEVNENILNVKVSDEETLANTIKVTEKTPYTWVDDYMVLWGNGTLACDTLSVSLIEHCKDNEYLVFFKVLFTDADIKEYNWNTQSIVFTDEFLDKQHKEGYFSKYDSLDEKSLQSALGGCSILGASENDIFVLQVDYETIYEGFFEHSEYSSDLPIGAIIEDSEDGICITFNGIEEDPRMDDRIKKVLEKKNIIF